jgi:hypothetical protein
MSTVRNSTNVISEITFRADKVRPSKEHKNSRKTKVEHIIDGIQS